MADTRLLHKRGSHGDRIVALGHLDFRVWAQYVLSADDYGVMRASASVIRADNPRLEREPLKAIQAAMGRVLASTLVSTFTHQSVLFWWQLDWQDFQQVRYPRDTVMPTPAQDELAKATVATQDLFALREKPSRQRLRKVPVTVTETSPIPTGAGGRQTQTQTLTPALSGSESSEEIAREPEVIESSDRLPPSWRKASETPPHRGGLIDGHEQRIHGVHAFCGRLCVPLGLHAEFKARLGGDDAHERLLAWYPAVLARYDGQPIGDGMWDFWRNEFAAWVGTVTERPAQRAVSRTGHSVNAGKEYLREKLGEFSEEEDRHVRALKG